jgi:transposase
MRPPGAPDQLQQRRRRAVQLLQAGRPMAAVARQVQASVSSVWRWWQTYQRAGPRGLQPRPTPGRPPRLSAAQQRTLERILAQGPRRAGYPTDLWTLARVAKVIRREFGIRYHPSHVWKLLTARGWQCQPHELSEAEKQTLLRRLGRGPRQAGPTLDRWTFGRVVELFRQAFGSQLHPSRIRQALTAHGWRCPRPARRAGQRDKAITAWGEREEWPWIKTRYTTWGLSRPR